MVRAYRSREDFWASSKNAGFFEKLLEWKADVEGESTKCATFKIQAAEASNVRVFVGMVKGGTELKIFHSMLKYNNIFIAKNISGSVIAFMGDLPLEGRPWTFKIPQDKTWVWLEIKFLIKPIEIQTHFSQEENCHSMWETTGRTNLTTVKCQGC